MYATCMVCQGGQKRVLYPLELTSLVVVSHITWVLRTQGSFIWKSRRSSYPLSHFPSRRTSFKMRSPLYRDSGKMWAGVGSHIQTSRRLRQEDYHNFESNLVCKWVLGKPSLESKTELLSQTFVSALFFQWMSLSIVVCQALYCNENIRRKELPRVIKTRGNYFHI